MGLVQKLQNMKTMECSVLKLSKVIKAMQQHGKVHME